MIKACKQTSGVYQPGIYCNLPNYYITFLSSIFYLSLTILIHGMVYTIHSEG